eukprot:TRINITY_DN12694_c0_g1_i3.p1 TRINITY_DN12694_c0_g1~~TRINITY_DN12694_c0_g1_i3.p1  ORF type:complete len:309 (+),score=57.99 TRINITY_DN12694_c0_g1_i3:724-1650(+)
MHYKAHSTPLPLSQQMPSKGKKRSLFSKKVTKESVPVEDDSPDDELGSSESVTLEYNKQTLQISLPVSPTWQQLHLKIKSQLGVEVYDQQLSGTDPIVTIDGKWDEPIPDEYRRWIMDDKAVPIKLSKRKEMTPGMGIELYNKVEGKMLPAIVHHETGGRLYSSFIDPNSFEINKEREITTIDSPMVAYPLMEYNDHIRTTVPIFWELILSEYHSQNPPLKLEENTADPTTMELATHCSMFSRDRNRIGPEPEGFQSIVSISDTKQRRNSMRQSSASKEATKIESETAMASKLPKRRLSSKTPLSSKR